MKKKILCLACVCMSLAAFAQDEKTDTLENRNVVVEKEYQPVIQDVGKILSTPVVMQASVKKKSPAYLNMQLPMDIENVFLPADSKPQNAMEPNVNRLLLELGYGNYYNSYARLTAPLIQKKETQLGLNVCNDASMGKRKVSYTAFDVDFAKEFKKFKLETGTGLTHRLWNYYGNAFSLSADKLPFTGTADTLTMMNYNAYVNFEDKALETDKFSLEGSFKYQHAASNYSLKENAFELETDFQFGLKASTGRPFGVKLMANLNQFTDSLPSEFLLGINPYWKFGSEKLKVSLGFITELSAIDSSKLYFSPDIYLNYAPFENYASFFAGIGGGVEKFGLTKSLLLNPYLVDGELIDESFTAVRPFLGAVLCPISGLQFLVSADYKYTLDDYFFESHKSSTFVNRFEVLYEDVSSSSFNLKADYLLTDKLDLHLNANYTKWWNVNEYGNAWLKPAFTADFSANLHLNSKLTLGTGLWLETSRYAKFDTSSLKLNGFVDWRVWAEYKVDKNFKAFVRLNNILNQHYQLLPGYDSQGINFMLGGSYTL